MTLEILRKEIDTIDQQMRDLFEKRMAVSVKVAEWKAKKGESILRPEREAQVIERLVDGVSHEIQLEYSSFLKNLMGVSRTYQYRKTLALGSPFTIPFQTNFRSPGSVCYGGLPGSYSEIAARQMFPKAKTFSVATFEEVFHQVKEGVKDIGVLPLENTTAGNVNEVYDLLLECNLYINFSKVTKVNHCLAAKQGAKIEDIVEIYSHPQAIAQSREFLKQHGIMAHENGNTAIAAHQVASQQSKTIGAVCSKEAARRYGLVVLKEGINHNKQNATKFVAVSKQLVCERDHDKISLVFGCLHKSGSLSGALSIFADYNMNLTEIHSRPDGKTSWEYLFYADVTGNLMDENVRALLFQLTEELPFVKILGSYKGDQ